VQTRIPNTLDVMEAFGDFLRLCFFSIPIALLLIIFLRRYTPKLPQWLISRAVLFGALIVILLHSFEDATHPWIVHYVDIYIITESIWWAGVASSPLLFAISLVMWWIAKRRGKVIIARDWMFAALLFTIPIPLFFFEGFLLQHWKTYCDWVIGRAQMCG